MKKLIFAACLLFPLGLFLYGKITPLYQEVKATKQVTDVLKGGIIRQIPLNNPVDEAFKQFPTLPTPITPTPPAPTPAPQPKPVKKHHWFFKAKPVAPAPLPQQPPKKAPFHGHRGVVCTFSPQQVPVCTGEPR